MAICYKIFLDKSNEIKKIEYTSNDQKNYFEFVKSCYEKGFKQVIITSKMMLNILEEFFYKKYRINEINFCEDDDELNEELKRLMDKIEIDRAYFKLLLDKLECLGQDSSIDIESIKMSDSNKNNGKYFTFSIRVNGIMTLSSNNENDEKIIFDILRKFL